MRTSTFLKWKLRQGAFIARALASTNHVVLAHIITMRRCNLACGYCNEYDHNSKPVPLEVMKSRIGKLAELGTSIVTISGGEPMMHPQLDDIIQPRDDSMRADVANDIVKLRVHHWLAAGNGHDRGAQFGEFVYAALHHLERHWL